MSVAMNVVGVAAYYNLMCVCVCVCVCSSLNTKALYAVNYTHTRTHRVTICCHNNDYVHVNGHNRTITVILAKHCTRLPDDGSSVIRNMLEHI